MHINATLVDRIINFKKKYELLYRDVGLIVVNYVHLVTIKLPLFITYCMVDGSNNCPDVSLYR